MILWRLDYTSVVGQAANTAGQLSSPGPLAGHDLVIWGIVFIISALGCAAAYLPLLNHLKRLLTAHRGRIGFYYLGQFFLGLAVALLIDRVGFRELLDGRVSELDRLLMPILVAAVPVLAMLSVLIPVSTLATLDQLEELKGERRQLKRLYWYMRARREDATRLIGCLAGALSERTRRLRELGLPSGKSSCAAIEQALDPGFHAERLVEAIHHTFEHRARQLAADSLEQAAGPEAQSSHTANGQHTTGQEGEPNEGAMTASDGEGISWRVALFEEVDGCLKLVRIWDGRVSTCWYTKTANWGALFSTENPQAGTFAVNCVLHPTPLIVADTAKAHDDELAPFKFFAVSPQQRKRLRSIAGFAVRTKPARVIVVDANRAGFFRPETDEGLLHLLQHSVQVQFEFESVWHQAISAAKGGCRATPVGPIGVGVPTGPGQVA